jgi:PAS domain S-box-containing protein
MEQFFTFKKYQYFIAGILVFLVLYLASLYNYLLFHSLAEIFSIVVACGIFMVAWNSRRFLDNNYLLFIGIAYLFVGGLDLIHTLTYKGMGIFEGYGTNLATQLWIAARYTESLSLLIAPLFFRRKLKINFLFFTYTLALSLFLICIFYWNIFPICFVEGVGLTPFKKISEYIISLILLASIVLVLKNRGEFDRDVLKWVVWSILVTIASELAFTFYVDAYGFSNLLGHFLKIVSFYLIYKALIQMGLTRPYDLLFRNLKQSEVLLREEKNKIQNYLDIVGVILLVIDANQKVSLINKKGGKILGYNENEMIGKNWFDTFVPEKNRDEVKAEFKKLVDGEIDAIEYFENPILTRSGEVRIIGWHHVVLRDEKGNTSILSSGEDITERKQMEKMLTQLASFPELNPNPVVEVDLTGQIHYLNPAAEQLFPDLNKVGIEDPWLRDLEKIADTLEHEQKRTHTRELRVGDIWYQQIIHSVMEGTRLRIYGLDITERRQMEENLRQSEAKFRILADKTYYMEFWTNPEGRYIFVSPSYERITGHDPDEFMENPRLWRDLVHPEDLPIFDRHLQEQEQKEKSAMQEIQFRIIRPDGSILWIGHSCQRIFDEEGHFLGIRGSNRDITERRRAVEELRRSRDELELRVQERTAELSKAYKELEEQSKILEGFFTSTITPLVFLDRNFDFIRVNKAYAKACQRDISEFLGHNHFEFYPHEENEAIFKQVVETKAPYQAFAKPFSFPDHPEWGVTYWDWTLTPILDDEGETEFLVFSLEDMTERKRTENSLSAAHQYNRSLIEASVDPLVTINPEGKVTDANKATEVITGVPRNQLIGSDFSDYFTEPEKARKGYKNVFAQGSVRDYSLAIRHTSGMITDVLYNANIYRNEAGEIQGIFAAARDVTDMKRAEEALRESETRLRALSSQLLTAQESERKRIAMELHDGIGQILTAIKFKVENILQDKGKGKARAKEKSLKAIVPMVRESVEEVRRIQMDLRPSTLDDLGILATLGWFCREYQKIYFHIRIEKEIGLQESEVSTPLKTVIYRLTQEALNNIAKHSKADLIYLSLRKREDRVEWVVKDNGIGFDLEKILSSERFRRGLGLNSMRERTELSGGSFEIETTLGAGTMIRASWPI